MRTALFLAGLTGVWAMAILVAWSSGHWEWMALGSRYVPPAPGTALLLLLSSIVLVLRICRTEAVLPRRILSLVAFSLAVALGVAAATRTSLPLEVWLTPSVAPLNGIPRGRTALATTVLFALLSLGLTVSGARSTWVKRVEVTGPLLVLVTAVLLLQGYLFGGPLLYGGRTIPVAALTALGLFAASLSAVLAAGRDRWPLRLLISSPSETHLRASRSFWWVGAAAMLLTASSGYFWARGEAQSTIERAEQALLTLVELKAREIGQWHAGRLASARGPVPLSSEIDLEEALTPLLRDVPASARDVQLVLWRRNGASVTALAPSSGTDSSVVQWVRIAAAGMVRDRRIAATDSHGTQFIAAMSPVPGTTWELAARSLREDHLGPIRLIALRATLLSTLIAGGLVLGLLALGSRRDLAIASRELELTAERARGVEELRQSEARYARAMRGTSDGLWDWDVKTGALYVSPHWRESIGIAERSDETIETLFFDRLHPDDVERVSAALDAHFRDGVPYSEELRLRHDDGTYRWFWTRGEAERDATGQPQLMTGAITDITTRRETEEALHRVDRILRMRSASNLALVHATSEQALHQAVCDVAVREGGYLMAWVGYAQQDAERSVLPIAVSGHERGYIAANPISWGDNERGRGPTGRCIRSGEILAAQDLLAEQGFAPWRSAAAERGYASSGSIPLKADGVVVGALMLYSSEPYRFDPEELALLGELGSDVSFGISAIRDHAAVVGQQDDLLLFRQVMERSEDLIFLTDAETGAFIDFNETASQRLGYSREELQRLGPFEIAVEVSGTEVWNRVLERLQHEHSVVWPRTYRRKDGTEFPVEVALTAIMARGRSVILGIARDVTEREQLTQQLLQSQKLESIGRLAGGVAHDFNNLLTVINATADLAITGLPAEAPVRQDLAAIRSAGDRAALLTHQLLAFGRQQVLRREVIPLNDLVNGFVGMIRRVIGEDIRMVVVLDESNPTVQADRGQLEQVLMNLSVNARDAMPNGGTLTITTSHRDLDAETAARHEGLWAGAHAMLQVSDTGMGMDASIQAKIFEPFFTTKAAGKGTGLGLSTVYGIVRQSGGAVHVESVVGEGSTFGIYLPLSHETARAVTPTAAAAPTAGTETILLVDDEEAIRRVAKRVLERAGYVVVEASNGIEALKLVRTHGVPIHLVMTDLVMPMMSGTDLMERLAETHPALPVLLTSGYAKEAIGDDLARGRALNFLSKPYTAKELLTEVRRVLEA